MNIVQLLWIPIVFLLWSEEDFVLSLKLTEVKIDKHTVKGNGTVLECKFDLEGETLYAVKWYKDSHEFYRYLPKEEPQIQIFNVSGIHVDVKHSDSTQVHLHSLELESTGRYRCEVSGEAPSFTTVSEHGEMVTVALPTDGPRITGGKPRYHIGDHVNVNCTSGTSKPAATLQWFINGYPVNSSLLRGPFRTFIGREGLEAVTLGLTFRVQPEHFQNGTDDMKLKCLATISSVYWKSNEESVEGEKQSRFPTLEIKQTNELNDDKSRADRVQGEFSTKIFSFSSYNNACKPPSWASFTNLLSLWLLIVPVLVIR